MSERDTARQAQFPAQATSTPALPVPPHAEPVALLIVDCATGGVTAANPAARRRLVASPGDRLGHWLRDLATAAGHRDGTVVRTSDHLACLPKDDRRVRALSTPIEYRSRPCLLVVLRDDAAAPSPLPAGAAEGVPAVDSGCAVFTMDAVGRVDSWPTTAQRLIGYQVEQVIGADTTLLHPPAGRVSGEHHKALTQAYRSGEHRGEGWRLCCDGRLIWAEVTIAPLYDATERLVGFAQVMHDLTPVRRLRHGRSTAPAAGRGETRVVDVRALPAPRVPAAPPAGSPVRGPRRPAGRIPTQRRP